MRKIAAKATFALAVTLVGLSAYATKPSKPAARNTVHPWSTHDPNVLSVESTGPDFGLFSCQVGRSVGQCYDPFQMRKAYCGPSGPLAPSPR